MLFEKLILFIVCKQNMRHTIYIGPKGGLFIRRNGKKQYLKNTCKYKGFTMAKMRKEARSYACEPGKNHKFANVVNGKCVRFGDPHMTIKKDQPGRKRSFCARHRCSQKRDKATPGYQSCKKWSCSTGS